MPKALCHASKLKSETGQYPALLAVIVNSPQFIYPSAVEISDT